MMSCLWKRGVKRFWFQVRCYGAGLEPLGCIVNKPADFTVDTHGAGQGELKLYAQVKTNIPLDTGGTGVARGTARSPHHEHLVVVV